MRGPGPTRMGGAAQRDPREPEDRDEQSSLGRVDSLSRAVVGQGGRGW